MHIPDIIVHNVYTKKNKLISILLFLCKRVITKKEYYETLAFVMYLSFIFYDWLV